jgi:hypothetical protein
MESLGKLLEFVGKYSWAVFVMTAFVLFVPDDGAKQLGLYDVRTAYKGFWWLALVLTGALWIGAVFSYLDKKVLDGWLERRRSEKQHDLDRVRRIENVRLRLNSLDAREQLWIKYCLLNNIQTLTARLDDHTAQSLVNKHILSQGSGSMLNLPFHIRDEVWRVLTEERALFLSDEEANDPRFQRALDEFQSSLHPRLW